MRILITGATGFIGRHLIEHLVPEHEVYGLVRRSPPEPIANVRYIYQDLGEPLNRNKLPRKLDAIIHQAAVINTDDVDDSLPFLINVVATWRLLNYATDANAQTFIHASTGGIYGCGHRPFVESDPPNPMDLYSLTKAQAELAVQSASSAFCKVVLRYCFPYGVGTPNPIPTYVRGAVLGEPIEIVENEGPKFNPVHISDAVEATIRALRLNDSATLNIAGTQTTTFAEIARISAQLANQQVEFTSTPLEDAIPYYRADLIACIERMQSKLAFTPHVTLKNGIAELVATYYNAAYKHLNKDFPNPTNFQIL